MNLYEYQAKQIFREEGINLPIPAGVVVESVDEVRGALDELASFPVMCKSQLLRGGRGKDGLIKMAKSVEEAEGWVENFQGRGVQKVLLEKAVTISRELYVSITVDAPAGKALVMASAEGGVEIEVLAETQPEKIIKEHVDIVEGLQPFHARDIAYRLDAEHGKEIAAVLLKMWTAFRKKDAELVEINPLFITEDGSVVAGDGKFSIDDNSGFRQETYVPGRDYYASDAEFESAQEGIPYLQFDGNISLMCAGAGLTTTVFDLVNYAGGKVANYLEFGGPNYRKAQRAMELCLQNDSAVILIVTFGTIARADVMAEGVVTAMKNLKPDRPIVTCIRGTNEEEAVKILREAGLEPLFDTEEAVARAVELAGGKK